MLRAAAPLQIFPTGVRATATGIALVLGLVGWLLATPVHDLYTTMPPLSLSLLSLAAVSPRTPCSARGCTAQRTRSIGASALRSHHPHAQGRCTRCMQIRRRSAAFAAGWSLRTCAIGNRAMGSPRSLRGSLCGARLRVAAVLQRGGVLPNVLAGGRAVFGIAAR